jgi:hypothetical protein
VFADLPWRPRILGVPILDVRGYSISMPAFDMGGPHRAEYRVSQLPDIGRDCTLYLAIDDPGGRFLFQDSEVSRLRGVLRLEVMNAQGVIHRAEGPLWDWTWNHRADEPRHRLYQSHAFLELPPRAGQEYTLRISYSGDELLAGFRGYCYLECGRRP